MYEVFIIRHIFIMRQIYHIISWFNLDECTWTERPAVPGFIYFFFLSFFREGYLIALWMVSPSWMRLSFEIPLIKRARTGVGNLLSQNYN